MLTLVAFFRYWREGALVALVVFGITMCHARDGALRAEGAAEANATALRGALRVSDSALAVRAQERVAAVAAEHRAEAARDSSAASYRAALASWQAIAERATSAPRPAGLATSSDAIGASDTSSAVPIPTIVQAGNALAARCSQVVTDCDAERAAAHALQLATANERDTWKDRAGILAHPSPPPPRSCTPAFTAGALFGAAGGLLTGENLRIPLLTLHR